MHNNIDFPSGQAIIDTINLFHDLGVDNEVTELDISIYSGSNPTAIDDYALIPQDIFVRQGYRNRIFFDAFRQLAGKIGSVTFWGQADDHTWLTSSARVNGPLLFDTSLKKKFAYWGVIDPLQLPGADLSTSVVADTNTVVSGNDLSYTITVRNNQDNDLEAFLPTDDDLPAANVSLTDAIPAGTVFKSLSAPAGWSCTTPAAGGVGQCELHDRFAGRRRFGAIQSHGDGGLPDSRQRWDSQFGHRRFDHSRSQHGAEQHGVGQRPGVQSAAGYLRPLGRQACALAAESQDGARHAQLQHQ